MKHFIKLSYLPVFVFTLIATPIAYSADIPARGPIPFSVYDQDGNNRISEQEFNQVRAERMAANAAKGGRMAGAANAPLFSDFDTDSDGQLTQQELTAGQQAQWQKRKGMGGKGMGGKGKGMRGGGNMPTFSDFDLNGDGIILEEEFNEARANRIKIRVEQGYPMKNIGKAPSFADIDTNGDGKMSAEEFAEHQTQHQQKMQQR